MKYSLRGKEYYSSISRMSQTPKMGKKGEGIGNPHLLYSFPKEGIEERHK